jgi:hypothetical protein
MQRCRDCNSTLKAGELVCYHCGTAIADPDALKTAFGRRFVLVLTIAFWGSVVLTVISPFTDFTPPFMRCLIMAFILLIIRSSAAHMMEKKGG